MGPENKKSGGMIYMDGKPFAAAESLDMEKVIPTASEIDITLKLGEPMEFTCEIRLKRMSQKRFTKKLMARGWDRNTAAVIAMYARFNKIRYNSLYLQMCLCGL